jgi:hypothetical protein
MLRWVLVAALLMRSIIVIDLSFLERACARRASVLGELVVFQPDR